MVVDGEQNGTSDENRLSARQYKFLLTQARAGFPTSIVDVCRTSGVSRTTFYRWMRKEPSFRRSWKELPGRIYEAQLPRVALAVTERAAAGDMAAARIMHEYGGVKKAPEQHEVSGLDGGPVEIKTLDDHELESRVAVLLRKAGVVAALAGDRAPGGNGAHAS